MIFLIFSTQLFYDLTHFNKSDIIYLIEEPRYFNDFKFHKLKLAYQRATMKKYYDRLKDNNYKVEYIENKNVNDNFYKKLNVNKEIKIIFLGDTILEKKLLSIFKHKLQIINNKTFLIEINELNIIKKKIYKNNKYSHNEFYKYQRKKLNILIDEHNKPIGGKWSYDLFNRKAINDIIDIPDIKIKTNEYIKEAINYVNTHWKNNYGSLDYFIYPIDTYETIKWLNKFLKEKLNNFGPYQDAVLENKPFLFHSILSPMMNVGLITDKEVINISYNFYLKHNISLHSFEGFIRQIIGWRNYVYVLYLLEGDNMRKSNQLNHVNKINDKFWLGTTNIKPIDDIIHKIIKYAYAHHIERLMYLGNFMLLCHIHPNDVYKIFMEWTIDAYDWVMVPNVYGMSQFSTSIMMTRPYFSSSNYIIKMSSYKKDKWTEIWDALYYNFIYTHKKILKSNYATVMQVKHWDDKKNKNEIKKIANNFLNIFIIKN